MFYPFKFYYFLLDSELIVLRLFPLLLCLPPLFLQSSKINLLILILPQSVLILNPKRSPYHSKQVVKLQVWDTAGQERYMSVNKNLFLRVQGMLLMYDITNRESFEHVSNWVDNIKEICSSIPIVLVGNKSDMEELRIVTEEEGRQWQKN